MHWNIAFNDVNEKHFDLNSRYFLKSLFIVTINDENWKFINNKIWCNHIILIIRLNRYLRNNIHYRLICYYNSMNNILENNEIVINFFAVKCCKEWNINSFFMSLYLCHWFLSSNYFSIGYTVKLCYSLHSLVFLFSRIN